jgi:hypothetical protein
VASAFRRKINGLSLAFHLKVEATGRLFPPSSFRPTVNVSLLDGQLAWRQHDGGHTDGPNWKYFIPWADRSLRK